MEFKILMDERKYLKVTTPNVVLYQGENYADQIQILVPITISDKDLKDFTIALEYHDENGNAFLDILEKDVELYKEKFIRCTLPVTSVITRAAGKITAKLSLNYVDKDRLIQYVIHSSEVVINIHPYSDYYKFSDDSLQKLDAIIGELSAQIDYMTEIASVDNKVPDDLMFDEDGTLHVSVKGVTIGTGVDVAIPGSVDSDENPDGIIDADAIYKVVEL